MAALRLNIPAVFVSGGPMEAGKAVVGGRRREDAELNLIDAIDHVGGQQRGRRRARPDRASRLPAPAAPAPACSPRTR